MDATNLFSLFTLAFGLGLLHALDADHLMAISGLLNHNNDTRSGLHFCLRWAIGHGITLFIIGSAVLVLGMAIPHQLSHYAEYAIACLLILIGAWLLWTLRKPLSSDNRAPHSRTVNVKIRAAHHHWPSLYPPPSAPSTMPPTANGAQRYSRNAIFIGILHGAAGSAPLLVLISLANTGSTLSGLFYILLFSLGVLCAMLMFGGLLTSTYRYLTHWGTSMIKLARVLIATGAIALGAHLLMSSH